MNQMLKPISSVSILFNAWNMCIERPWTVLKHGSNFRGPERHFRWVKTIAIGIKWTKSFICLDVWTFVSICEIWRAIVGILISQYISRYMCIIIIYHRYIHSMSKYSINYAQCSELFTLSMTRWSVSTQELC